MKYYAMIDIGASSGRIMLAEIDNKQLALQEVHRFKNGFSRINGSDRWDIETIFQEILTGLSKLKALGVTATVRVSFSIYNTMDDVERLAEGVMKVKKLFK